MLTGLGRFWRGSVSLRLGGYNALFTSQGFIGRRDMCMYGGDGALRQHTHTHTETHNARQHACGGPHERAQLCEGAFLICRERYPYSSHVAHGNMEKHFCSRVRGKIKGQMLQDVAVSSLCCVAVLSRLSLFLSDFIVPHVS